LRETGEQILEGNLSEERRKEQLENQNVSIFLRGIEHNCRLTWEEIIAKKIFSS